MSIKDVKKTSRYKFLLRSIYISPMDLEIFFVQRKIATMLAAATISEIFDFNLPI